MDSAHQVIVAARATNQTSDKQQAAAMMEETIDNVGAVPREVSADAGYYSAKAVDELYALGVTRSSRRSRPATAGLCHRRPEAAYPVICLPGTGCDGSYRPGGVGSATLCGCKLWSRYSARSSRPGVPAVPAAGTGEGERRMVADLHGPQPAQIVPLWGQSAQESTGPWASPTHQELLPR